MSSIFNYSVAYILVPKLSPVISRDICGVENGAGSDFSASPQAVICQYHSTVTAEFCCSQQDRWARPGKLLMTFRSWRNSQGAPRRKVLLRTLLLVVMKAGILHSDKFHRLGTIDCRTLSGAERSNGS